MVQSQGRRRIQDAMIDDDPLMLKPRQQIVSGLLWRRGKIVAATRLRDQNEGMKQEKQISSEKTS